jgi:hypothetical protein
LCPSMVLVTLSMIKLLQLWERILCWQDGKLPVLCISCWITKNKAYYDALADHGKTDQVASKIVDELCKHNKVLPTSSVMVFDVLDGFGWCLLECVDV